MTEHIPAIDKLADENIRKWVVSSDVQDRLVKGKVEESIGPYITISRETGAGGSETARMLGEKMGWDVLDKDILNHMAERYGTPRDLLELADEKTTSLLEDVFKTWIEGHDFIQATYVRRLCQLFLLSANHGRVVIVGRGAQHALPRNRGLAVRLVSPLPKRIERITQQKNLSRIEAKKFVEDSDRQRDAFVKKYFHKDASDAHAYDLVVNIDKLSIGEGVDLIVSAVQSWLKNSGIDR